MRRSLVPLVVGAAAALEEVRVVGFLEGLTDALAAHYAREGAVLVTTDASAAAARRAARGCRADLALLPLNATNDATTAREGGAGDRDQAWCAAGGCAPPDPPAAPALRARVSADRELVLWDARCSDARSWAAAALALADADARADAERAAAAAPRDPPAVTTLLGSSTLFPLLEATVARFVARDADPRRAVVVTGGGSTRGARAACLHEADAGAMSRGFAEDEAASPDAGATWHCLAQESVEAGEGATRVCARGECAPPAAVVAALDVAYDALTVFVRRGGKAAACVQALGGLSLAQLRWIYSDRSDDSLENDAERPLALEAVAFADDFDGVREWSDLSEACDGGAIRRAGADALSGTHAWMRAALFGEGGGEGFAGDDGEECFAWTADCTYVNSAVDADILAAVRRDGEAVGFAGYNYVANDGDLMLVSISPSARVGLGHAAAAAAVAPSPATLSVFPLARPLSVLVRDDAGTWQRAAEVVAEAFTDQGLAANALLGYGAPPSEAVDRARRAICAGAAAADAAAADRRRLATKDDNDGRRRAEDGATDTLAARIAFCGSQDADRDLADVWAARLWGVPWLVVVLPLATALILACVLLGPPRLPRRRGSEPAKDKSAPALPDVEHALELRDVPPSLVCPITMAVFHNPVICADGHTYERQAIERWLEVRATSPTTNLPLESRSLAPNHAVRAVLFEAVARASAARPAEETGSAADDAAA
jgi:ABC-type phosphate transport system substrate-binding protein